jgi:predicted GTPase
LKTIKKILIMGAAGRDFHNFNVAYKQREDIKVVGFTATQIPDIEGRLYPPELAGQLYPQGIMIHPEEHLRQLIRELDVDTCVFSYSDISHADVMHKASQVLALGASFMLLGPKETMITSEKPVIAVCAVRTGVGKSAATRRVVAALKNMGLKPAVIRHPMPYGDLAIQACQRFATYEDLDIHKTTIEEREEYEPHIDNGTLVFAGVDYEAILRAAEQEADVILWDGGNNDFSFIKPDIQIVLVDPHRPGHEVNYHPGEANLRMADIVLVNKVDTAEPAGIEQVMASIERLNPGAIVVKSEMPVSVEQPEQIQGKRVLVVEDGPTLTHGEMAYGAGVIAARQFGAEELVDPRPYSVGSIRQAYAKYSHLESVLPALGYSPKQLEELEKTINQVDCDLVLAATPIDLTRLINVTRPIARVRYEIAELGMDLEEAMRKVDKSKKLF